MPELTIARLLDPDDDRIDEERIYLFALSGSSEAAPDLSHILCTLIYPETGQTAMVGIGCVISGRISRPGTVAVSGIGAASVNGLSWQYVYTPLVGEIGSRTFTVTATDAANGTTSTASVTVTVVAAFVLPSGVTPRAWLRHDAPAFQDLAGTVPATSPGDPVRRVNNVSPLSSYWQSPAGACRKDPAGVRLEPTPSGVFPMQFSASGVATSIQINDVTLAVSWVQRWGQFTLTYAGVPQWSANANSVIANSSTGYTLPGFASVLGAHHSMVITWTSTGIRARMMINGVMGAAVTLTMSVSAGNPNDPQIVLGQLQSYMYDSLTSHIVTTVALSPTKADEVLAAIDSIPAPPAFPLDRPLLAFTGDSMQVGIGVDHYDTPKFAAIRSLRAAYDPEMLCTAIVGTSVNDHATYIAPFYDARRRKNVAFCAAGTNDIATHNGGAVVLAAYFVTLDAMRAQGWDVIASTILPRSNLFAGGADQTYFNTEQAIFNNGLAAAWSSHASALFDTRSIVGIGANGDSAGGNYSDGVHLNQAGYALYNPPLIALFQARLAA